MNDHRGSLHLPLALLFLVVSSFAMGTVGLLSYWTKLTSLQIRMDRCVGGAALDIRDLLNAIDAANGRIRALRALLAASTLAPKARPAVMAALRLQVMAQDSHLARWKISAMTWLAQRGCGTGVVTGGLYPSQPYERPPPDVLGSKPLAWTGPPGRRFILSLHHPRRRSYAEIISWENSNAQWRARWTSKRPGLD